MRFHRHFKSREEMIKVLKEYLEQLQAEAKGVEECIVEMEQTKESHQSE
jgi:mannitol/fructose-specific phosphotransferase system IIA component (Ntr-type)